MIGYLLTSLLQQTLMSPRTSQHQQLGLLQYLQSNKTNLCLVGATPIEAGTIIASKHLRMVQVVYVWRTPHKSLWTEHAPVVMTQLLTMGLGEYLQTSGGLTLCGDAFIGDATVNPVDFEQPRLHASKSSEYGRTCWNGDPSQTIMVVVMTIMMQVIYLIFLFAMRVELSTF